jgi:vitamin B12 transporter
MYSFRIPAACFALALSATASSFADEPDSRDTAQSTPHDTPQETLIVTATRTEIPVSEATVPVSVITREDIELSLANDLADLLRFQAGIDLGRNGGPGQATSLFLRGTESNHTLVLVDGVRINPGTVGGAAIQNIAPELVERIEVVKGARSALFGTDAIGGVINVITRRPDDGYIETGVGAGSDATRSAFFSAGDRGSLGEFGVTLNAQTTDGFPPRTDSDVARGYDNLSASLYASHPVGQGNLSLHHWESRGNVEYLDFFLAPVDQDYRNATTALEWSGRLSARGSSRLVVSHMLDDIDQNQSDDFVRSERLAIDWQYNYALSRHLLTAGLYGTDEDASTLSFGSGFDEHTRVRAAFLQDQWSRGPHRTFVALRLTDHESLGQHTTWNAEYALDIGDAWTLNAGIGHAFRAPDATDRFGFGGNPDLLPEIADEAQFGLRYASPNGHSIDLELYANDIDDLIEFDLQSFLLENIDRVRIRGAQLGYDYRGDVFAIHAEVVRQNADDATTGERLLRRAEESGTLSYTLDVGHNRFGVSVLASGDREDFGGVRLAGYVLVDLTAELRLGRDFTVNARIENLFDKDYQTADDFRMPGRGAYLGLRYRRD